MKSFWGIVGTIIVLGACVFGNLPTTANPRIAPELLAKIADAPPGKKFDIIVWLTEPDGWAQRRAQLEQMRGKARKIYAVQSLKEFYFSHAENVLNLAFQLENSGDLIFGKNLWGAFSFSAKADRRAIEQLAAHPDVRMILPDEELPLRFMMPYDPKDPFDKLRWKSLRTFSESAPVDLTSNKGITTNAWQITHTHTADAWATGYNGEGVVVVIFDTGVDYTHPDLQNRMWHNPGETPDNGVDDDGNGYVDDYYGYDFYDHDSDPMDNPSDIHHGTNCAGMVAGDGTSGWATGAAPGAKIMAVRIGNGTYFCSSSDQVDAFQYAVNNGADVASMSFGSYPSSSVKDYYRYVINTIFGSAGIPVAVAAGNGDGSGGHYTPPYDISTPADIPPPWYNAATSDPPGPVIAVGATNTSDGVASFSSIGPTVWDISSSYVSGGWHDYPSSNPLIKPDIAAPGANIVTTSYGGGYEYTSGTSFACPFLAGIIAVLLSKNGELTPREIDSVLEVSATDISDPGRDNYSGAGLVNTDSALSLVTGKAFVIDSVRFDDLATGDGDRNLDPGETGNVLIYLRNAGSIAATGVQVTVTSVTNPNVSVIDANSNYGTINAGETGVNTTDPIVFSISSSARYSEFCKCYITISDESGYSRADSFAFRIGTYPYQVMWHDTLAPLRIDVSNFGVFGYYGGLYWPWPSDSTNNLYISYPLVGQGPDYVAEGGTDLFPFDSLWQYNPGASADKETYTALIDSVNEYYIRQYTYQWRTSPDDDFIIFYYKIFNRTDATMSGVRAGFYADFDIARYDSNYAVWDDDNEWVYMYRYSSGKYFGLVALQDYALGSVVDNPQYVYGDTIGMGWTDTVKWNFLTGTYSEATGSSTRDWSVILSFGPYTIAPRDYVVFAVAIVAGNGLSDFTTNANTARSLYGTLSTLSVDENGEQKVPEDVALFGTYPNPFNSATRIMFALTEPSDVSLNIYDLSGKLVRHFEKRPAKARNYSFTWDGTDETGTPLPTGVYLIQLQTAKTVLTKKVLLAK